jgi:hypothetical protein
VGLWPLVSGPAGLRSVELSPSRVRPWNPHGRIQVQAIDPELDPTRILQTEADVAVRSSCTTCGSPSAGADAWGS